MAGCQPAGVLPLADRVPTRIVGRGGMDPKMAKQLQEFQKVNTRLKKLVADQVLDMLILKEASRPHACVPEVN